MDETACAAIPGKIADLQQQIEVLEELLDDPELTPQQKASVRQQIKQRRTQIAALKEQLAECQKAEITILGVEKTQGTQYFLINGQGSGYAPDNSVPLVAQRALILRVYVDSKKAGADGPQSLPIYLSGRMTVERVLPGGTIQHVTVLEPINGPIVGRRGATIDRGEANHSLNFRVQATDCQGTLRFTVSVFDQGPIITPVLTSGPTMTMTMRSVSPALQIFGQFEPVPAFRVHAVLVHYIGGGVDLEAPTGLEFASTLDYVLRTYPIGRLEFEECLEIDFDKNLSTPGGGCGPGFEGPGGLMEILQELDDNSDRPAIRVALIPRLAQTSVGGCGNRNIAAAKEGSGSTLAQEMGHALDRKHAPAGGAPGADPNYPVYGSYPLGSIGEYGFDIVTSDVYNPSISDDFMSYGEHRWVSPYTYMGLRDTMYERFGDPRTARTAFARIPDERNEPRETLFLAFRVKRRGEVDVRPSFHLPARACPPGDLPLSDICCELLDADGEVLVFHRCRLRGSHVDPDGPHIDFHEPILWMNEAVAIRFLRKGEELHVHPIEAAAPTVRMTDNGVRESGTPTMVRWDSSHPTAAVKHLIRHSADNGETWRVVAANVSRDGWRPRQLPGGERCLFQVVATSGIRTSVASTEAFAAPRRPRRAVILSPSANAETQSTKSVHLRGGAFSSDFGLGAMEDVAWTSSLAGVLGTGFEVFVPRLAAGTHVITVTVPDGEGGVTTASTLLKVTSDDGLT